MDVPHPIDAEAVPEEIRAKARSSFGNDPAYAYSPDGREWWILDAHMQLLDILFFT